MKHGPFSSFYFAVAFLCFSPSSLQIFIRPFLGTKHYSVISNPTAEHASSPFFHICPALSDTPIFLMTSPCLKWPSLPTYTIRPQRNSLSVTTQHRHFSFSRLRHCLRTLHVWIHYSLIDFVFVFCLEALILTS